MALSGKQLQKVQNLHNMINNDRQRKTIYKSNWRPDITIFRKLQKYLTVWVQNAENKAELDSESELHELLYAITAIISTPWNIQPLLKPLTTKYGLEQCQLHLVRGLIDHGFRLASHVKEEDILPSVYSYYLLVK